MPCDYSKYPKDWKTVIRPKILKRENNCCKFCGVENNRLIHRYGKEKDEWEYWPEGMQSEVWSLEGLKSTKIVLTISHLDHDTTNNDYKNLAALCQKCHLSHDKEHHMKNSKETNRAKKGLQNLF
jgi:hypothetical protein